MPRLLNRETGKSIKSLQGLGFTQETQKVVSESNKGSRLADTLGLRDFNRLIAFAENWLYLTLSRNRNKTLKTLQGYGFDAYLVQATVERPQGGSTTVGTINLDSFNVCIAYGVQSGKKAALALQLSLTKMALMDFFRDAFGDRLHLEMSNIAIAWFRQKSACCWFWF